MEQSILVINMHTMNKNEFIEVSKIGRNALLRENNNHSNNNISTRSNVMKTTQFITRGLTALLSIILLVSFSFGAGNLNLNGSGGTLSGTFTVKGNINTGSASAPYTFSGTMNLSGTSAQSVGGATGTPVALTFATLNTTTTGPRNQTSPTITVSTALSLAGGNYVVGAHTLNIDGTSSGTVLDASSTSSIVNFRGASAQTVLTSTYSGTLGLSGAGAKDLGGDVVAGVVSHTASSGALSINNNLTITANSASSLDAISISASKTLEYQGTNTLTIATVSSIAGTGIIQQTTGASGTIAFTNGFTNGGTIQTGTGVLTFNGNLNNTGGSVILTSTGTANFAADITTVGTMTFANTSTVNFTGGSAQSIPGVNYGALNMSGAGVKTALNNITMNGAFNNGSAITDMSTYTLGGAGAKTQAAGGTMRFGGASNGLLFTSGTVEYNAASGTQSIAGHTSNTYTTLLLSGGGTKQVATGAANTVHTIGDLTIGTGITLDVLSSGVVQVDGDMTINGTGTVTNLGAITVGS
jgi:hypothetical protein